VIDWPQVTVLYRCLRSRDVVLLSSTILTHRSTFRHRPSLSGCVIRVVGIRCRRERSSTTRVVCGTILAAKRSVLCCPVDICLVRGLWIDPHPQLRGSDQQVVRRVGRNVHKVQHSVSTVCRVVVDVTV